MKFKSIRCLSIMARLKEIKKLKPVVAGSENNANPSSSMGFNLVKTIRIVPDNYPSLYKDISIKKPGLDVLQFQPKPVNCPENSRLLKVSLLGAPNSGKSTLINSICQSKLSLTSCNPHSTMRPVIASWTRDENQVVFLDNPGIMPFKNTGIKGMQRRLAMNAWESISDSDLVMCIIDASACKYDSKSGKIKLEDDTRWMLKKLRSMPLESSVLVLNKIDKLKHERQLFDISDHINDIYRHFQTTFMVSATKDDGIADLRESLLRDTKPGEWLYNAKDTCCIPLARIIEENIRQAMFELSERRKIPFWISYKCSVKVQGWTQLDDDSVRIDANVTVRRSKDLEILSQPNSEINLKRLRKLSNHNLERQLKRKIYLFLNFNHL